MSTTGSRTLQLLSLLQTHRHWSGDELAGRLGVSQRTLRRDVDRLRELGYPVEARRGVDGGYQLGVGASLPPLLLDDEEAVALAVGLQAAAQGSVVGIEESSVRALAKVAQVLPPHLKHRIDALQAMTEPAAWSTGSGGHPAVDPGVLTTVAQACRDNELLRFAYTAGDGRKSERRVEPHRMVALGRRWYLAAFDLDRSDWRSFRLDRAGVVRNLGHRFSPRQLPAPDAAAFVRAGIDNLPSKHAVEAVVEAPGEVVRARVGRWCSVDDLDDGRCTLRMTTDYLDWPLMALGMTGAPFTVVGPPALAEMARDWGARFVRAGAPEAAGGPPT